MALLSIVLPVYGVQGYLEECLDSILGQSFTDFEIIAVDDCSPDHSGAILDDYAARDPRVRVVHLEKNVGLGEARNIGLTYVTGEYVWFVDSDDWLADGALWAIAERLHSVKPDVLAVDYAKVWWDNTLRRSKLTKLLAAKPVPEVFQLKDYPHILTLFHVAWNKVFRRQFLLDNEIRFPVGLYEDVPVGYPVLILAERISILLQVCLYYRQRRRGAITSTPGKRHLEVFKQYDLLFENLDKIGPRGDEFRPIVFQRMLHQGLLVLDNPERVAKSVRPEFFALLSRAYNTHLPKQGYDRPEGKVEGLKHRALARGSLRLYDSLQFVQKVKRRSRKKIRRSKKLARKVLRKLHGKMGWWYYRFQLKRPIDKNVAVYSMYWGHGYGCNPAAIYEKARELVPNHRGVWEVEPDRVDKIPQGVEHVVIGTFRHYRMLARAKYLVSNVNYPNWVVKRKGSVHLSTNHGTPLKAMGVDQLKFPVGVKGMNMEKLLKRCDRWDYSISPNAFTTRVWERAYPCSYKTLEVGYPRNDRLATATQAEVERVRGMFGLRPDQQVILYMPTHREYQSGFKMLFDVNRFVSLLGPDTVVLLRAHHFYENAGGTTHPQVVDVSDHGRVEDLYLAADVLITDYSSAMFDYAILDRPIVIYAPDWHTYRAVRGVYFDLLAEPPGAVATTEDELIEVFLSGKVSDDRSTEARQKFRRKFCYLEDGKASERVVRHVFLGQPLEAPPPAAEGELAVFGGSASAARPAPRQLAGPPSSPQSKLSTADSRGVSETFEEPAELDESDDSDDFAERATF